MDLPEEGPAPTNMSWNEAVASGSLSKGVMDAVGRLENNDYAKFMGTKATENQPTETAATKAQDHLKGHVIGLAADKQKIEKSKAAEQVYGGITGLASGDVHRRLFGSPRNSGTQALSDTLDAHTKMSQQNYAQTMGMADRSQHLLLEQ